MMVLLVHSRGAYGWKELDIFESTRIQQHHNDHYEVRATLLGLTTACY